MIKVAHYINLRKTNKTDQILDRIKAINNLLKLYLKESTLLYVRDPIQNNLKYNNSNIEGKDIRMDIPRMKWVLNREKINKTLVYKKKLTEILNDGIVSSFKRKISRDVLDTSNIIDF
ncbi:hypothetical protein H8356DRAFT_1344442 [Neocallimastix lanati (nom. inval.)]|nr:hypothetical protein H8356DRAFT_1344442 [Neocallimastix sp. JGI-2020a]